MASMAGRYASALFEVAREQNLLAEVERDLETFAAMLASSADHRAPDQAPEIGAPDQEKALNALIARAGIAVLTRNFLRFIARNRRLFAVADMIADFRALLARERGVISAEVTTAHPLIGEQTTLLKETLRAALGKSVSIRARVDANLLGGMVVKVGSKMIDSSLRTKLNNLKVAMKGTL